MPKKLIESGVDEGRYTLEYALFVAEIVEPVVDEIITADRNRGLLAKVAHNLTLGRDRDRQAILEAEQKGEVFANYAFGYLEEFDRRKEKAYDRLLRMLLAEIKDYRNQ